MKILHINANPKPLEESASLQVTEAFFRGLDASNAGIDVERVDLYKDPPPFYGYEVYRNYWYPVFQEEYQPSAEEKTAADYSKRHGELLNEADVLVLTSPMWNFSSPAILKAWIDQVVSPGLTFTIGPDGVKPLHKIKKIVLFTASGGVYEDADPRNNLDPQIKAAFGFIGVSDVEVVWADGQNGFFFKDSAERKSRSLSEAETLGRKIAASL